MRRFIADRSVRTKFMSVVVLLSVVAGAVALFAVTKLAAVYGTAEDLVTESLTPQSKLAIVQVDVQKARVNIRDVLLARGETATATAVTAMHDADKVMDADVAAYLEQAADPGAMREFQHTWAQWRGNRDDLMLPAATAKDDARYDVAEEDPALLDGGLGRAGQGGGG